jgi:hypothetical protein
MSNLTCVDYSEKAIVVRGETKECKEQLKKLGGIYNARLKDGPGWIFSKKSEDKVLSFIASGKVSDDEWEKIKPTETPISQDILPLIDNHIKTLDLKQRLELLAHISKMCLSLPVLIKTMPVKTKENNETKEPVKNLADKPIANIVIDSDEEFSDDVNHAPKRLLQLS